MTIQLVSQAAGKNKRLLQDCLNIQPSNVHFYDPSIFAGSRGSFTGADIPIGDYFPVVMDHPKRMRFAEVVRRADGSFSVK